MKAKPGFNIRQHEREFCIPLAKDSGQRVVHS